MAAAAQIDPARDPLDAAIKVLGELESICDGDATSLARSLGKVRSKVQRLDGYAKTLQTFLPKHRLAIRSQMHNLKDTVAGFIQYESTPGNRRDVEHYMDRTKAAERLRNSVDQTANLFRSITY